MRTASASLRQLLLLGLLLAVCIAAGRDRDDRRCGSRESSLRVTVLNMELIGLSLCRDRNTQE